MNWKRTVRCSLLVLPFLLLAIWPRAAAAGGPQGVRADANAVLYEAVENVFFDTSTWEVSRVAVLQGSVNLGTALCPYEVLVTNQKAETCTVTVFGERRLLTDGVRGTFAVVVEGPAVGFLDTNPTDSPEFVVMAGDFTGSIELHSAVGTVRGSFVVPGGSIHDFEGTVRLPIAVSASGHHEKPRRGRDAFYVDDRGRLVPVRKDEYSLGYPTVRIELWIH